MRSINMNLCRSMAECTGKDSKGPGDASAFKQVFKFYKRRDRPVDLTGVFDPAIPNGNNGIRVGSLDTSFVPDPSEIHRLGLKPVRDWTLSTIASRPGLFVLPDIFRPDAHLKWIDECLHSYTKSPNVTNIGSVQITDEQLLTKLRWATLGHHYDWKSKQYDSLNPAPFPPRLSSLSRLVISVLNLGDFHPEAAIVNYYHPKSYLSGHIDQSELTLTSPLTSISFGQSAVYLSGGPTLNETPMALMLRSGDVMVLSGKQRLVYHGVPRLVQEERRFEPNGQYDDITKPAVMSFANSNRISITVRQFNLH